MRGGGGGGGGGGGLLAVDPFITRPLSPSEQRRKCRSVCLPREACFGLRRRESDIFLPFVPPYFLYTRPRNPWHRTRLCSWGSHRNMCIPEPAGGIGIIKKGWKRHLLFIPPKNKLPLRFLPPVRLAIITHSQSVRNEAIDNNGSEGGGRARHSTVCNEVC